MPDSNVLPSDPVMLLSLINTQLRDRYPSLGELCKALGVEELAVREVLAGIDYEYDPALNKFV